MSVLPSSVISIATTKTDHAFLVEGDNGYTLIDVGWTSAPDTILDAVAELRRKPSDIRRIVITHAHPDHVQGAAELRARTGAPILIHPQDEPWLMTGHVPRQGRSGRAGRLADLLPKLRWAPFAADGTVADGDLLEGSDGLRVIHTPGHSPGHIMLLHEPSSTLFTGDAVFNRGELGTGRSSFAADPDLQRISLRRVPQEVRAVGFAHGPALAAADLEGFWDYLHRISAD